MSVLVRARHVEACTPLQDEDTSSLAEDIRKTWREATALVRDPKTGSRDRNLLLVNTYSALREILAMLQSLEAIRQHPEDPEAAKQAFLRIQQEESIPC